MRRKIKKLNFNLPDQISCRRFDFGNVGVPPAIFCNCAVELFNSTTLLSELSAPILPIPCRLDDSDPKLNGYISEGMPLMSPGNPCPLLNSILYDDGITTGS